MSQTTSTETAAPSITDLIAELTPTHLKHTQAHAEASAASTYAPATKEEASPEEKALIDAEAPATSEAEIELPPADLIADEYRRLKKRCDLAVNNVFALGAKKRELELKLATHDSTYEQLKRSFKELTLEQATEIVQLREQVQALEDANEELRKRK